MLENLRVLLQQIELLEVVQVICRRLTQGESFLEAVRRCEGERTPFETNRFLLRKYLKKLECVKR